MSKKSKKSTKAKAPAKTLEESIVYKVGTLFSEGAAKFAGGEAATREINKVCDSEYFSKGFYVACGSKAACLRAYLGKGTTSEKNSLVVARKLLMDELVAACDKQKLGMEPAALRKRVQRAVEFAAAGQTNLDRNYDMKKSRETGKLVRKPVQAKGSKPSPRTAGPVPKAVQDANSKEKAFEQIDGYAADWEKQTSRLLAAFQTNMTKEVATTSLSSKEREKIMLTVDTFIKDMRKQFGAV